MNGNEQGAESLKPPMTGVEFRTIRETLGLSQDELSKLLPSGRSDRAHLTREWVNKLEGEKAAIFPDVAETMHALEDQLMAQVETAIAGVEGIEDDLGSPSTVVDLSRYRTEASYRRGVGADTVMPWSMHSAIVRAIRLALKAEGHIVKMHYIDAETDV